MITLSWTKRFIKSSEKFLLYHPELIDNFKRAIQIIETNPFDPILKTHKLKGRLENFYSCSISFQYRIIFEFVQDKDNTVIVLLEIGSHDEVY